MMTRTWMVFGTAGLACLGVMWAAVGQSRPGKGAQSDLSAAELREAAGSSEILERAAVVERVPRLSVRMEPVEWAPTMNPETGLGCPPETHTYSSANFDGGEFVLQAGFVEQEICAVTFTPDPEQFPIKIDMTEVIVAQENPNSDTVTAWSMLFWEGTPGGPPDYSFSSDGELLPHIVMGNGINGTNVQFSIDPGDPDQIILGNDGSSTFSVGFRIDAHNDPPSAPCNCVPPLGCLTPSFCCPPDPNTNAFPTTDSANPDSADFRQNNWLFCRSGCGELACPAGWHRFDMLDFGILGDFEPGGDWNIRVTYTPVSCEEDFGACCLYDGTCMDMDASDCTIDIGLFQDDDITCAITSCPEPEGACCVPGIGGGCFQSLTEAECVEDQGGFWLGGGTLCDPNACFGACCFEPTGCANLQPLDCVTAGGEWAGSGMFCAEIECNPMGACCLPDGSCLENVTDDDCDANGGVFQGDGAACAAVECPQPVGACCLTDGNCLDALEEATCMAIPEATWQGMQTTCADTSCSLIGACCLESGSCLDSIVEASCLAIPGASWAGGNTSCKSGACEMCTADFNNDDIVDSIDLLQLLGEWGQCEDPCEQCVEDIAAEDCIVDTADLLELLGQWGDCP